MQKKVFSKENGNLEALENGHIYLFDKGMIATTEQSRYNTYLLPSSLIRNPKSDEDLAIERYGNDVHLFAAQRYGFIAGPKSVSGEFHLTREQLVDLIRKSRDYKDGNWFYEGDEIIESLTPSIYPTSIEVDFDGTNYDWSTIKANYDN